MTTENQIVIARSIAFGIQTAMPWSCKAEVDDWSDTSSFRVFVSFPFTHVAIVGNSRFHFNDKIDLRKAGQIVRKALQSKMIAVEKIVMPKLTYRKYLGVSSPNGYDRCDIQLDFRVLSE